MPSAPLQITTPCLQYTAIILNPHTVPLASLQEGGYRVFQVVGSTDVRHSRFPVFKFWADGVREFMRRDDESVNEARLEAYLSLFKREVVERMKAIDPNGALDNQTLAYGWAVAKGMKPENAVEFAGLSYFTDYSTVPS